jgi:hypothetical protein
MLVLMTFALDQCARLAGLAWTAHIGFDRFFAFALRTPDGFQRT